MEIYDKDLKTKILVSRKECPHYDCYWPRPDPGNFIPGRGYTNTNRLNGKYLCGNREIHSCPENPKIKEEYKKEILKKKPKTFTPLHIHMPAYNDEETFLLLYNRGYIRRELRKRFDEILKELKKDL